VVPTITRRACRDELGGSGMPNSFTKIDTPQWMLALFKSIDDLDVSEDSGFRIFADDIALQFGPKTAHGIENVKKFFIALDEPFITKHFVDVVYQFGDAYFMQGSATLRKKDDPSGKEIKASPLFNLLWFHKGKVIRYVVDFDPMAAKAAGF
jgi:hypothetical protein